MYCPHFFSFLLYSLFSHEIPSFSLKKVEKIPKNQSFHAKMIKEATR